MAIGCPEFKDDRAIFTEEDFNKCVREMRPIACKLIEDLNLNHYMLAYDENNNNIKASNHDVMDLIPPRRKHIFTPDLHPFFIINDEATFEALTGIDWILTDLQMADEEEPPRDDA